MKQRVLHSERLKKIKKERHKILHKRIYFFVFIFVFIFTGLSFLSRWNELNINDIKITGNKIVESSAIENVIKNKISGYYLYFFPKTNFLIYPRVEIKNELLDKFKRIKDISFIIPNLKTLDVSLTERTALYTYCGKILPEINTSEQKCYFMDESGYIFDEAPYFSGDVYLRFYGEVNSNDEENPSGLFFSQTNFLKFISFKDNLEKMGIKPAIFSVLDNGNVEVYLSSLVKSQNGPKIIFKIDSDIEQVLENLQSILATEPLQTDFKAKYSSLLYIDLRFGNKVYYKFK